MQERVWHLKYRAEEPHVKSQVSVSASLYSTIKKCFLKVAEFSDSMTRSIKSLEKNGSIPIHLLNIEPIYCVDTEKNL